MSNAATGIAWHHSAAPTQTTKLILIKIADMNGDGGAWPSMDTLAQAAMVTKDAARKAVRQLEALGEIRTHLNEGGGLRTQKHMRTNVYEFLLRCPWYCDGSARHLDLRDEKNANFRPRNWVEISALSDTETPQPQELPPAPGTGAPQPQELPNHNLTQQPIETWLVNDEYLDASARDEVEDSPSTAEYENWSPAEQVRRAAEAAAQARAKPKGKPAKPPAWADPPAPRAPSYPPASTLPPEPAHVLPPEDERAMIRDAGAIRCTAHDGRFTHLIAPDLTCARCGEAAATILERNAA